MEDMGFFKDPYGQANAGAMDFLERRLGYLLIEYDQLEKARELFTRLLDNPDSCRFAREELDYIAGLENKG